MEIGLEWGLSWIFNCSKVRKELVKRKCINFKMVIEDVLKLLVWMYCFKLLNYLILIYILLFIFWMLKGNIGGKGLRLKWFIRDRGERWCVFRS